MATWSDLSAYIHSNYKVAESDDRRIKLVFETGSLRSQVVMIWYLTLNDGKEAWIQVESPFGELGSVDLTQALQAISSTVCGGLALVGNLVTFRHAVPLENLNINEIEAPLALVTTTADQLERALTGGDRF
jgi:hypothetical protein